MECADQSDVTDFTNQIAGHTKEKLRCFKNKYILKPCIKESNFNREIRFYDYINCQKSNCYPSAYVFCPKYYGTIHLQSGESTIKNLILEDLTKGYSRPSIMDVKMGRKTFDPFASDIKIQQEIKKYLYQSDIGFRITAFRSFRTSNGFSTNVLTGKKFGRSIHPDNMIYALGSYFFDGKSYRIDVIRSFIRDLEKILRYMEYQTEFHFYCSSILFIYETTSDESSLYPKNQISLIDFAHVYHSAELTQSNVEKESRDLDYIYGLKKLINYLIDLYQRVENFPSEKMKFISNMYSLEFSSPEFTQTTL